MLFPLHHPWLFVLLSPLPAIVCLVIDTATTKKVEKSRLPAWCNHLYSACLPVFVGAVGLAVATILSLLMEQQQSPRIAELTCLYASWFVAFWDLIFSFLSLFSFAMFFDAYKVWQSTEFEFMKKKMPELFVQLIPTVVWSMLASSGLTIIVGIICEAAKG